MSEFKTGVLVRVKQPSDDETFYRAGGLYVVVRCDPSDQTLRARAEGSGVMGPWLQWHQCEVVETGAGWQFLKKHLTPATAQMLEAFDGVHALRLNPRLAERILRDAPGIDLWLRAYGVSRQERAGADGGVAADEGEPGDADVFSGLRDFPLDDDDDIADAVAFEELDALQQNKVGAVRHVPAQNFDEDDEL